MVLSNVSSESPVLNGFVNDSFACYMNVVLQVLLNLPGLKEFFLSGQYLVDSGLPDDQGFLVDQLAMIYRVYHSLKGKVIDPLEFKKFVAEKCSSYNLETQEDAHEFTLFLINTLSEELNKSALASPTTKKRKLTVKTYRKKREPIIIPKDSTANIEDTANKIWDEEMKKNYSICTDLLMGQIMSEIECKTCLNANRVFQVFYVLELPLPDTSSCSLEECIAHFSSPEVIAIDQGWICEVCKEKREASKRSVITRLPPILMVYFKRFIYSEKTFKRSKTKVEIKMEGETIKTNNGMANTYLPNSAIVSLANSAPRWVTFFRALHSQRF